MLNKPLRFAFDGEKADNVFSFMLRDLCYIFLLNSFHTLHNNEIFKNNIQRQFIFGNR